jgi:hypothetical protein
MFFGQRDVQVSQEAQRDGTGTQGFLLAPQLDQTDDLLRWNIHGVSNRKAGRTLSTLITPINVLPGHFVNLPGKESRMSIQDDFHLT